MQKKILFVQTNYPGFLEDFYKQNLDWKELSYSGLKKRWADIWFASADFYSRSLKSLGWDCQEVVINDQNQQTLWAREHKLKVTFSESPWAQKIPESIKKFLGVRVWIKQILFAQIKHFKPDVVYFHDLWVMNKHDLVELKKQVKLVVGQIASPIPPDHQALREYDLIITSFPHFVSKFTQMGIKSEYLKWCAEKSLPEKIGSQKKIYDTVFIGSFTHLHTKGRNLWKYLSKKIKLDLWGFGKTDLPNYHGVAYGRKMYEIFAKAKIVINRHIDLSEDYANNMRMYEATAMGALLLTDHKVNMEEFFRVGKEVVTYNSPTDLVQKVKYYLAHPKERVKIAKAGQKRTLKDHSYKVRIQELDKVLRKYL